MKTENMSALRLQTLKLVYSALFLALALVLPFITGQNRELGTAVSPMHIPAFLCGFVCGWPWGLAVGAVAPLLRHVIFSGPPMPTAAYMAVELAVYGLVSGLLYKLLPKKPWSLYVTLIAAMLAGRAASAAVQFVVAGINRSGFSFGDFLTASVLPTLPGVAIQLVLIPLLVLALDRARLTLNK